MRGRAGEKQAGKLLCERDTSRCPRADTTRAGAQFPVYREIAANFTSALADYFRRVASNDAQDCPSELSCLGPADRGHLSNGLYTDE